ncbi:MAG: hypothetical protein CMJ50_03180 [Planctomycetaceae bacterium]|nr:hypothetical protein [Planctomycetaceae bacterium]
MTQMERSGTDFAQVECPLRRVRRPLVFMHLALVGREQAERSSDKVSKQVVSIAGTGSLALIVTGLRQNQRAAKRATG